MLIMLVIYILIMLSIILPNLTVTIRKSPSNRKQLIPIPPKQHNLNHYNF